MGDDDKAKGDTPPGDEQGAGWIIAGIAAFGAVVGLTTGLSTHEGISSSLLSALFSFAGGVILTYGGFTRRTRAAGGVEMRLARVGGSLLAFSLAVAVGLGGGILAKGFGTPYLRAKVLELWPGTPDKQVPTVGLQAGERDLCKSILKRAESEGYSGAGGAKSLESDLRLLCQ